ncbi:protein FAM166C-like [Xenia sp. Carnegie-2017]|uniref:protein FAM166C-like n=1 Tax=Xenia sp. Carnegie-2017 TaxID=2897299 RepID=UPI001F03827D|nr:protein FAM166C-like [Xenia sp. Carnegie-2017]
MACYMHNKYATTSKESYRHPKSVPGYPYYTSERPQDFGKNVEHREGSTKWFQDHRRPNIVENILKNNIASRRMEVRPSKYSDSPDRVLGARCTTRNERLNRPDCKLFNRLPDKERQIKFFVEKKEEHRQNYKDLTGTKHQVDYFHYAHVDEDQFSHSKFSSSIKNYPSPYKGALEYSWLTERGPKYFELYSGTSDFNHHQEIPEI